MIDRDQLKRLGFSESLISNVELGKDYSVFDEVPLHEFLDVPATGACSGMVVKGSPPSSSNLTTI